MAQHSFYQGEDAVKLTFIGNKQLSMWKTAQGEVAVGDSVVVAPAQADTLLREKADAFVPFSDTAKDPSNDDSDEEPQETEAPDVPDVPDADLDAGVPEITDPEPAPDLPDAELEAPPADPPAAPDQPTVEDLLK